MEVCQFIATERHPYSLVDQEGFKAYAEYLVGGDVDMPSRYMVTKTIDEVAEEAFDQLSEMIQDQKQSDGTFCFSFDGWESWGRNFLGSALFFIDNNLERHYESLELKKNERDKTGESYKEDFDDILSSVGLTNDDVSYFVTDGERGLVRGIRLFKFPTTDEEESSKTIEPMRNHCVSHRISLIMKAWFVIVNWSERLEQLQRNLLD